MDKLRIGVVGLRFGRHLVTTFHQMAEVELVAVADRSPTWKGRLEAYAEHYGAKAYTDGVEMMAREDLGAVCLCVSPRAREPLIRHAASAGLAMVIEKPWATHLEHAQRLAAICRQSDAPVMVAFSFRFMPAIAGLRELMLGELGVGWLLNAEYIFRFLVPADNWLWDPENGNGLINENTCHLFDAVCYLMGKPVSVMAEGDIFMGSPSVDGAAAILRFEGGGIAALTCGGIGAGVSQEFPRLDVVTANGQAHLTGHHHIWDRLTWEARGGDRALTFASLPEMLGRMRYVDAMRHFVDCVRTGRQPSATVEDGVMSVAVAMGVYESARTGRKVALSW